MFGSPGTGSCTLTDAFHRVKGLRVSLFFITLPHGHPHTVFKGFIFVYGGWVLLCKEFTMAKDSPPHNYAVHDNILV